MFELPRLVSKNSQADILWRRQYEELKYGQVLDECLDDKNIQCLYYYPMTLILGRVFERIGEADKQTDVRRLFVLAGKLIPYLGIRWQQSKKARGEVEDPDRSIVVYGRE
jgi:hypothetical protein